MAIVLPDEVGYEFSQRLESQSRWNIIASEQQELFARAKCWPFSNAGDPTMNASLARRAWLCAGNCLGKRAKGAIFQNGTLGTLPFRPRLKWRKERNSKGFTSIM